MEKILVIFSVKRTQIEMVRDRGYLVPPEELAILDLTVEQFFERYLDSNFDANISVLNNRIYTKAAGNDRLGVFFFTHPSDKTEVPVFMIRKVKTTKDQFSLTELVVIVDAKISNIGRTELANIGTASLQIFRENELTYNPTKHVTVPVHRLLTAEEAAAVLKQLKVDSNRLLVISDKDPIVKYYGWNPGNIVKIERDDSYISTLFSKTVNYRLISGTSQASTAEADTNSDANEANEGPETGAGEES